MVFFRKRIRFYRLMPKRRRQAIDQPPEWYDLSLTLHTLRIKTSAPATLAKIHAENRRDLYALMFAVPWQIILFLTGMMILMKQWSNLWILVGLLIPLSAGLYWFWFRHLSEEVQVE